MNKVIIVSLLLFSSLLFSQNLNQKILNITRVNQPPRIDASLDDAAWKNADVAKDFVMLKPDDGTKEPDNIRSEVKVVYDDEAIYFAAYLHDDKPEEIPMEFETRDRFGNADFFGVVINPQNDGINQTEFFVMSTGNQNDAQTTSNGEDFSWNAVWDSKVMLVDNGWIVEMKIPYSALRFSNEEIQTWSINFHRHHRKNRHQYSWNYIDKNKGKIGQYDGLLKGIKNIEPPIRLSFNPYVYGAIANYDNESEVAWNAGMDIKYGLTENFTLDATLIPDFGQAAFDNVNLNLGPFEQKFSEKRAFFTEGTDLFSKGNFFYSRRIGNTPTGIDLNENEEYVNYPDKVKMLNAIKVSGRTKNGLGIGVFNAITETTRSTIKKTEEIDDGFGNIETIITKREEVVEPFANYNVLVLDKQFNKNSYVSLVNTNVMREGSFRDANVTGLLFNLNNKSNTYGIRGGTGMTNVFEVNQTTTGFQGSFDFDKTSGKHRFGTGISFRNKDYNQNDLGFQRKNNDLKYKAVYSYRILKPVGNFNNLSFRFYTQAKYLLHLDKNTMSYQEKPNLYLGNYSKLRFFATTKKQISFGANIETTLGNQYDYYEPRNLSEGRFYVDKPFLGYSAFISTDYSKPFALDFYFYRGVKYDASRNYTNISISPRFRFNNRFNLKYNIDYETVNNKKGYVNNYEGSIILGNRDEKNITNTLSAKYNFSTKVGLNLTFRHNWNPITYDDTFFKLNYDGTLSNSDYAQFENNNTDTTDDINHNINYNSWNIDLNFKWEFAPGSELVALYRNQIGSRDTQSNLGFADNLDNLFKQDQLNSFSLKLIYYLDYNEVKSWL